MNPAPALILSLLSILMPAKLWYGPEEPLKITVKGAPQGSLVLTDFAGKNIEAKTSAAVEGTKDVDLKDIFPGLDEPGTYILYMVPDGKTTDDFVGTPLVISVRENKQPHAPAGPMVTKVEPLCYAVMSTADGDMTMAFYYDVAPATVDNFLTLAEEGFYNGLTFHRIVPGFVIQGGDPRGDGTGGPGYQITAEFSKRHHEDGVLSMARNGDPYEGPGNPPRPEYANSAGSQFFICLNGENTKSLDGSYTAFGKVVKGMEVVQKIALAPLADTTSGKPAQPQVINKVQVKAVDKANNPYKGLIAGLKED